MFVYSMYSIILIIIIIAPSKLSLILWTLYQCRCINKRTHAKALGDEKGSGLETTDPNNNNVPIKFGTVYGGFLIKYIVDWIYNRHLTTHIQKRMYGLPPQTYCIHSICGLTFMPAAVP